MGAWRELIQDTINKATERAQANPGVQNFGTLVRTAMELGMTKKAEARQEAAGARNTARSAVYSRYPQVAARDAGIALPEGAGAVVPPEGLEPYQVVYDEQGNPTVTYRAPDQLTESELAKMYSTYVTQIRSENARNSMIPKYNPIPVPSYTEWKTEYFPEFAGGMGTTKTAMSEAEAEEWLRANGAPVTPANIQAVIKKFSGE